MSLADMGRTSLKNNKRTKRKLLDSFLEKPIKRIYKKKEHNPHVKNMSKSELKNYRKKLEAEAKKKKVNFWFTFIILFFALFIYLIIKM